MHLASVTQVQFLFHLLDSIFYQCIFKILFSVSLFLSLSFCCLGSLFYLTICRISSLNYYSARIPFFVSLSAKFPIQILARLESHFPSLYLLDFLFQIFIILISISSSTRFSILIYLKFLLCLICQFSCFLFLFHVIVC